MALSPSHLSMVARLSGTEQIAYTTTADAGVCRIDADIDTVVPAAVALGVRARCDFDSQLFRCLLVQTRARSNQYTAQIVLQSLQGLLNRDTGELGNA